MKNTNELIYLAAPYQHPFSGVIDLRVDAINRYAAKLMSEGRHVFSPITHSHPLAMVGNLPGDWKFWEAYDRKILSFCTEVMVLKLHGWEESKGVAAECKIAEELGIPVTFVEQP